MNEVYVSVMGTEIGDMFQSEIVSIDELIGKIVELRAEVGYLTEKIDNFGQEEIDPSTEYGVSDRDFI